MAIEKRRIGNSELEVAPLALGGNVFDWTADERASFAVLDAFVDAGGTMIDTADVYSVWVPGHEGGESERLLGRWLKRNPAKRDKVVIATKVGFLGGKLADGEYVAALRPDQIRSACEASHARLGIDRIDLYYQHKDNPEVPLADSLGAMTELADVGKIGEIGLSQFAAPRLQQAMDTATDGNLRKPVCLQPWYNLVERGKFEPEVRDAALRNHLGVFPFFSLANGFLTGKYRSEADLSKSVRGERSRGFLTAKGVDVLKALDGVSAETGAALATISLAWLMAQPSIVAPIASATSVEQLEELTAAMELKLSPHQLDRLSEASSEALPA
jgi:aryl-alcohol dehydrogenase-like predicted oxidoreductase